MNLTYVEKLPEGGRGTRHNLQRLIEEFINSGREVARVDFTDGKGYQSWRSYISYKNVSLTGIESKQGLFSF